MLLSKGTPLVLGLSILLLGLSGCAQTPTISQADREAYLQQFIGQSVNGILKLTPFTLQMAK